MNLINEDDNAKQVEGDPHPKATLEFTVDDAAVLTHLVSGFRFDSALCDCDLW